MLFHSEIHTENQTFVPCRQKCLNAIKIKNKKNPLKAGRFFSEVVAPSSGQRKSDHDAAMMQISDYFG